MKQSFYLYYEEFCNATASVFLFAPPICFCLQLYSVSTMFVVRIFLGSFDVEENLCLFLGTLISRKNWENEVGFCELDAKWFVKSGIQSVGFLFLFCG